MTTELLSNRRVVNMERPEDASRTSAAPSPPHGPADGEAGGRVRVEIQLEGAEGKRHSVHCALGESVRSVKERVCEEWAVPLSSLSLSYNGETLSATATIEQLGLEPGHTVELLAHSSAQPQDHTHQPRPPYHTHQLHPPDHTHQPHPPGDHMSLSAREAPKPTKQHVFTVQLEGGKEVLVTMEMHSSHKPFLGGYRHRQTDTEYHHASSQTVARRVDRGVVQFNRDTQTYKTRNKYQQVMMDAATQMDQTGCYVEPCRDQIVSVGTCESATDYHTRILGKVIILQTHWRRWLAQQYVSSLRREREQRQQWEREEEERRKREREERLEREFKRRMNPKTKEDFELLYHALEVWRQDEMQRINATRSGAERKAALCELLEQEAVLIASLGQHRMRAGKEGREKSIQRFLDATAAPKRWIAFDGDPVEMNTPFTLRAQQLRDIYHSLTTTGLTADERLDLLLTVKCTVKEHDCGLTHDLVSLVDREADLLSRGLSEAGMEGLRRRIATLFFQYCRTPLFNPEAAHHIKVPQDPSSLRLEIHYCRSCQQYLHSTEFELSSNSRIVGRCRKCLELDNEARGREDKTVYRAMLRELRKTEEQYKDGSQIIFLVQDSDLRYLVETVWCGRSVLSAECDVEEVQMVRWRRGEEWSPWNCVLLTREEAQAHLRLEEVEMSYGPQLISLVIQRHVLAKTYFSRIAEMVETMRSKVKQLPLPRPPERVVMAHRATPPSETTPPTVLS